MPISHSLNISAQTIPVGAPVVVGTVSFTAVAPVDALAGQQLTAASFTLNTDAAPATYPTSGTLAVPAEDAFGNTFAVKVTYAAVSGSSFTGCTLVGAPTCTSVAGPADPVLTGTVTINKTGSGNRPWLNTLTSASSLSVAIESSADGGATWQGEAAATVPGGITTDKAGQTETALTLTVGPVNPVADAVRMVCTASGPSAIEVSGSGSVTSV